MEWGQHPTSNKRRRLRRLAQSGDVDVFWVGDAEFEEGGVGEEVGVGFGFLDFGESALALEFLHGENVEGDGVAAEAQFVEDGGVMQQAAFLAEVLADQGVGDVQDDMIAKGGKGVDFGNRGGEAVVVGFEADGVVHAAGGEAEKISEYAGFVVVHHRRDVDDFRHPGGDEFRDERFAADAFAFFSEFEIAPDEVAEERGVVKNFFVVAGFGAAADADAELFREIKITSQAQVGLVLVPNGDVVGGQTGFAQFLDDGGDDGWARATVRAGFGKHFNADGVVGGEQAEPGVGDFGFAGQGGDAAVDHGADAGLVRLKGVGGERVLDNDDFGAGNGVGGAGRRIEGVTLGAGGGRECQKHCHPCKPAGLHRRFAELRGHFVN
jgi:hypothetical protein